MKKSVHYPTLNTILMVEDTLKNSKQKFKKDVLSVAELKKKLPRKVNHITLMTILDYLEKSKKINVTLKGISWREDF
ncbi:MAG TPA: hypothetical protein PLH46_02175 [Caldisericia bacterium]|nr:hypothetical protein [Caldisericia bacterium]